jgi:hypothetical protein
MEKEEIKQIYEQLESNSLSENNLERLILLIEKKKEGFSEPDFLQGIIDKLKKRISIKEMAGEESFWVYEFLEWAEWNIIE